MAEQLEDPPVWLTGFADYLNGRHHASHACAMLSQLGRLLADGGPNHPQALLERAGTAGAPFARALEDFLTGEPLALPTGREHQQAARRRQRRVEGVPDPLRPAVVEFSRYLVAQQERARRSGTKQRNDHTIDIRLDAVRDLARFLVTERDKNDWATVGVADIEAFLATQPARRASRLAGLRQFFAHAARQHAILIDPTRTLTAPQPRGFRGPSLTLERQRELFRRWTSDPTVHPHEAFVGLIALLHGATTTEIQALTDEMVDHTAHTVTLGRRPQPAPLDPWTWAALERCLAHRRATRSHNHHLLVTTQTRATRAAASTDYIRHTLDPAGIAPRILRSSRLLELTTSLDPKLVAVMFGMTAGAALFYLADSVDPGRLHPEEPAFARTANS